MKTDRQSPTNLGVNWRQAAGEGFILLLGVLLALGTQAWWEARTEKQLVRGHVANLLVELSSNAVGLERTILANNNRAERSAALIRLLDGEVSSMEPDYVLSLLGPLTTFTDFRPATAALDNLVGAGGLGLFGNTDLQLAVSRYAQAIEDHNALQLELAHFHLDQFVVFLREYVPMLSATTASLPEPRPTSQFVFEPTALVGSLKFENLLLSRIISENDSARFSQNLLNAIEELRPRLERIR